MTDYRKCPQCDRITTHFCKGVCGDCYDGGENMTKSEWVAHEAEGWKPIEIIASLKKENKKLQAVAHATKSLLAECKAMAIGEQDIIEAVGRTNWQCFQFASAKVLVALDSLELGIGTKDE